MEYATVNRFCAIEGTMCSKKVPFKGEWTFFFAYPSTPHWKDFSAHLVEDFRTRGIEGERWEDLVKGELIFSKVCDGIYGHDFLLAEVTEPNANVLLEVGYALAVGRQPVLLVDKTRQTWSRHLLTTLESCFYDGREQILEFLAKLQSQPRATSPKPDRRLPLLESMGIFEREETQGTVYHLRPKVTPDWVRRVDSKLRGGFFKLTTMDPSDSVYDEFYAQARKIQESQLVVASLVSQQHVDWEQLNANVALLIGFAIGLGKPVLVLHESPAARMLDLGTVLRVVESESHVERIVDSWLAQHTQELVSQRSEQRQRTMRREKAARIRGLYLGHPDALQDNNLLDYFVPTKEYEDALSGRRTLFIGRRGTGKSANFQAVTSELSGRLNLLLVDVAPEDFQLERLAGFLEDDFAIANASLVYQTVWNYVVTSEILRVLSSSDRLYVSPEDNLRTALHRYCQKESQLLDLDFGTRLIVKLRELSSIPTNLSNDEKRAHVEETVKSLRDYQIGRHLRGFSQREDITYFVIADDLDKHWRPDTQQSIDLLLGLVSEADRLQRFFEGRLKIYETS